MPLVSFHDVQKTYRSLQGVDYPALEHFSLDIEVGEFFCLLGPSGCGKTTVLKMLAGFEGPTAGRILMEGRPVTGASRDRGVVFQGDDSLYGWLTAVENVEFGLRMRRVGKTERRDHRHPLPRHLHPGRQGAQIVDETEEHHDGARQEDGDRRGVRKQRGDEKGRGSPDLR